MLSLSIISVPQAAGQPENIKVVSYSWYIDSLGYFVVVGEVQNIGSETIDTVGIGATVYTVDGSPQADAFRQAYVKYLVPQQKAPFYIEFSPTSSTGDTWIYYGIDRVDFVIVQAEAATKYQYPDLRIRESAAIVENGVYWASGTVLNNGTQTAKNIRIVGTYYNSSGAVVAVGYTDILTPTSLNPSGLASFKVGAFDLNQTEVPSNLKISSYSLLIQTEEPILSGTPPSPSNSVPNDPSKPMNSSDSNLPLGLAYSLIAVITSIVIIGIMLFSRKRQKTSRRHKLQTHKKQASRRKS
jgi:hypothetical protein